MKLEYDRKSKELQEKLFALQEEEQRRMHLRLEFQNRMRLLRYSLMELASVFTEKEIQHKSYGVFHATFLASMPEYRKKAILSRIEEIQSLWNKLLEQKKDPILLASDVEEFRFMMYTYCQISIQEEGKNLLKLEAK